MVLELGQQPREEQAVCEDRLIHRTKLVVVPDKPDGRAHAPQRAHTPHALPSRDCTR